MFVRKEKGVETYKDKKEEMFRNRRARLRIGPIWRRDGSSINLNFVIKLIDWQKMEQENIPKILLSASTIAINNPFDLGSRI